MSITAQQAIDQINSWNSDPGYTITIQNLKDLADQVDVSTGSADTIILYSGGVGDVVDVQTGFREFRAKSIAEELSDLSFNGSVKSVVTIEDTQLANLLLNDDFISALNNAATNESLDFDAIYTGVDAAGNRINNTSFWDDASFRLVTENIRPLKSLGKITNRDKIAETAVFLISAYKIPKIEVTIPLYPAKRGLLGQCSKR